MSNVADAMDIIDDAFKVFGIRDGPLKHAIQDTIKSIDLASLSSTLGEELGGSAAPLDALQSIGINANTSPEDSFSKIFEAAGMPVGEVGALFNAIKQRVEDDLVQADIRATFGDLD